jgi:hypothetical protein
MADDPVELAEQLRTLGRGLSVHVPDDLGDRVLADIAAPGSHIVRWRRLVVGIAALLAAIGVSAAVSAPVRAAISDVFGFAGVEIRKDPGPAPASSPALPGEHRVEVAAAEREVGFRVRIPSALGPPDWVSVADGRVVSLHYTRAEESVQIDEFAGDLGVMWEKYAAIGSARRASVNGHDALWFEGQVTLVYVDANNVERTESARLTNGTLLWTDGGITFRLDGIRPFEDALAVAGSMS